MPEDLGERTAFGLLDEIFYGGCIDSTNQSLALLMLAMTNNDAASSLKIGRLTQQSISMLRNIKAFWNLEFKIDECQDEVYDDSSDDEQM